MNKSIYEEALADAQKLREVAEETAKNRVLQAIMPQIKHLVDQRILGEQLDAVDDLSTAEIDDLESPEEAGSSVPVDFTQEIPEEPSVEPAEQAVDAPSARTVVNIDADGDVNLSLDAEGEEDDFVLTDTMAEALKSIVTGKTKYEPTLAERVQRLNTVVGKLKMIHEAVGSNLSSDKKRRMSLSFAHCIKEAMNLRSEIILNEQRTQEGLERKLTETIKEMSIMSKSNRNIFDFLFEAEEDKKKVEELEEAELSLELDDEEREELVGVEDVEAVDTALDDILSDLEVVMADAEPVEGEGGLEDEGLPGEEEGGEEAPAEDELDLGELDEMVYEIDESVLRRELRRMRHLREQEEAVETYEDHPAEEVGDVFYDVNEDDLLNVLADELGPVADGTAPAVDQPVAESRRRRSRRAVRNRKLQERRVISKYQKTVAGLKKQLVEMNLFNAKLLYANKLMQNKDLSVKLQRGIVEAIDNAKTLREAKLLYKSLSESLTRRARGKKLNEGALRTLGSSSRSTRSAQPASSGVEVDRWAVLAGLNGKN